MRLATILFLAIGVFLVGGTWAQAGPVYTDTLTLADLEIDGNGDWNNPATTFTYEVWQATDGYWHYKYTYTVPTKAISHMILELTPGLSRVELVEFLRDGSDITNLIDSEIKTHGATDPSTKPNPGMPADMWGIKLETVAGAAAEDLGTTATAHLKSLIAPMWGDWFSVDGQASAGGYNWAHNAGFGANSPFDPQNPTLIANKILVPNSHFRGIPEPGTMALLGLGLGVVFLARRRRRS